MAAPNPLPAVPAYELGQATAADAGGGKMYGEPIRVAGSGTKGTMYRLPSGFQNDDLALDKVGQPPDGLGKFYPDQKMPC